MRLTRYVLMLMLCFAALTSSLQAKSSRHSKKYKYQLCLCAIFQDEKDYLREWIHFHLAAGVEHFYLYNNSSQDDYMSVLKPFIDQGIVELFDWPNLWPDEHFTMGCQPKAYTDAINRCRNLTRWLAIIDTDEFLFPLEGLSITKTLNKYFKHEVGVVVNWQCYGTSDKGKAGPDELMIENLTKRAPQDYWKNWYYKSVVRPKYVVDCGNPHFCNYKDGRKHVDMQKVPIGMEARGIFIEKLRINHYWVRDKDFLVNVKLPRYQYNLNYDYWNITKQESEMNAVEDKSIFKYVYMLKAKMGMSRPPYSEWFAQHSK